METTGTKFDDGKPRLDLFPFHVAEQALAAASAGAVAANPEVAMCYVSHIAMRGAFNPGAVGRLAHALIEYHDRNAKYAITAGSHALLWAKIVEPVLAFGAEKYGDWNWYQGMKWSRLVAALQRHLAAIVDGQDNDPETGLLHVQHALCNVIFLATFAYEGRGENDLGRTVLDVSKAVDAAAAEIAQEVKP